MEILKVSVFALVAVILIVLIKQEKPFIKTLAGHIFSFIFIICLSYIIAIRNISYINGFRVLILYFGIILSTDYFASIFGTKLAHKINSKKLIEKVSPNKTIIGSLGGLLFAIIFAVIFELFVKDFSILATIVISIIISLTAQFSDLSISLIKRDIEIKHSSNFFYAYGGFIDRIDSFIFSAPTLFYIIAFYMQTS